MLLLIALALVVVPALTYYSTTALFFRSAKNAAAGKKPPTIPYLVPGVFHTFSIAAEGPQKFFARLFKEFGNFAPFTVKAGLQTLVVLRDPKHIKVVTEASKLWGQNSIVRREYDGIFEVSNRHASTRVPTSEKYSEKANNALAAPIQKHLTGTSLAELGELYASKLSSNMDDKMFQVGTWTQIEDFWSFFQQVFTRCLIETLFGSAIFRQYPKFVKDYWKFEDALETYVPGMSWLLGSSAYEEPRQALLQGIEKWIRSSHNGSGQAKIGSNDPSWDELRGSRFIQEVDGLLAEFAPEEVRAVELLKVIHWCVHAEKSSGYQEEVVVLIRECSSNTNLIPSAIWSMIEILRNPELANQVNDVVSSHRSKEANSYGVMDISNLPIMKSLLYETSRLRTAQYMIYSAKAHDILLDREYILPKRTSPIAFSHDVALDGKSWAKARPRTVEIPLHEFWAGRYLIPDKPKKRRGVESGEFSLDGLELLAPAFGGHQSPGLGREYAEVIHAATFAVLLNEWEIQLCDPEETDAVMPPMREKAFGAVKPMDRIAVRIRKRKFNREL